MPPAKTGTAESKRLEIGHQSRVVDGLRKTTKRMKSFYDTINFDKPGKCLYRNTILQYVWCFFIYYCYFILRLR